jgi:hypothetical protein
MFIIGLKSQGNQEGFLIILKSYYLKILIILKSYYLKIHGLDFYL